jgi:hypothetical protein
VIIFPLDGSGVFRYDKKRKKNEECKNIVKTQNKVTNWSKNVIICNIKGKINTT